MLDQRMIRGSGIVNSTAGAYDIAAQDVDLAAQSGAHHISARGWHARRDSRPRIRRRIVHGCGVQVGVIDPIAADHIHLQIIIISTVIITIIIIEWIMMIINQRRHHHRIIILPVGVGV
jgi:hypothetical protein